MWIRLFKESFLFAYSSVSVNKLRTFLSLFGITIGIVSIISVFTVFDWMENGIRTNIESLGDNTIYVEKMPWTPSPDMKWWDMIRWPAPSIEDFEAVQRRSVSSEAVCFTVFAPRTVKYRNNSVNDTYISGVTYEFDRVRSFELEKGRYFTQAEAAAGKPVAIIGAEVAERLFDNTGPLGKEITISGYRAVI
ncbi:MAG: ABC transporter permease, partial [Bacteroidales bacterium]|nr:ABC transporter permease [Bacteroidales bacterium]